MRRGCHACRARAPQRQGTLPHDEPQFVRVARVAHTQSYWSSSPPSPLTPLSCYSLLGVYATNAFAFHAADGSGYELLASAVLAIDAVNPQVASRIVGAFNKLKKVDAHRQALMRAQLLRMQAAGLSSNVGELVTRALST